MTPKQRRGLPPQAQMQYSERPINAASAQRISDRLACGKSYPIEELIADLSGVVLGIEMLNNILDAAEDTLALIAANGPVGVKMAVAKAQSTKPPPFPICDPVEWKQTATGERYYYAIDRTELERAILAGLGFDDSYRIVHSIDGSLERVWITKGDVNG